ncbi:MAG: ABC transporter permease subunit [Planctomycetota bacterium]
MAKWTDWLVQCGCWLASLSVLGVVSGLALFLLRRGAATLGPELLFGDVPAGAAILGQQRVFDGLWPALVGTLLLVFGAALIATPLGVASGIWLAEYGRGRWGRAFSAAASVLAAVPSIIMGLFGFGLILLLRQTLAPQANTCLLLSMICLAFLVLPYLIRATEAALTAIPEPVQLLGPALGLSRWQCIWHVHLPAARRGIQSGIVLAVGRIAEDTAVILMTGVVASAGVPQRLTDRFEALPSTIYFLAAEHRNAAELDRAFGAALVLLCLTTLLLCLAYGLTRFAKRTP